MCFRPSTATASIICSVCGTVNDIAAKTCSTCGNDLVQQAAEAPPPVAAPVIPGLHNLPNLSIEHPEIPGSSGIRTNIIGEVVNDSALWKFLKKGVVARAESIDCWYSSQVTALIQDPKTTMIVGVEVEHEGRKFNIAARNGVVMALGGYENNPYYTQQCTGYPKVLPVGTLANEGDGIRMAQAAGARLWHMNAWESSGVGLAPEQDRIRSMGDILFFKTGSCMLVGGDARRYIAEDLSQRHGRILLGGTWVVPVRPDENYFIFDETQRQAVLAGSMKRPFSNWTEGFVDEIASGKLLIGYTIEELAGKLALDADALRETIEGFNNSAVVGYDALGRRAENMRAFDAGPYYALPVFPSILATQGGPERTAKSEILDTYGVPIPHLYSAGEFGGITARNYQGGDSLSECIIFGRTAGKEAAAEKADVFEPAVDDDGFGPGSGSVSIYDQNPAEVQLPSTEATGIGEGLGGPIWVKITVKNGVMRNIDILHQTETDEVGAAAIDKLVNYMLATNSVDIDIVSGATVTSLGVKEAVAQALAKLLPRE